MTNSENTILTVGSLAFDTVETPAGKADQVLGGSCNYFSIAASFFTPVQIVGVVGQDFPQNHLETLNSRGIDISGVEISAGKTFHWSGKYNQNLNEAQTLATDLNVLENFNPKLSPEHQKAPYVFLANIDPDLQLKVLEQNECSKLVACDSMNFWIEQKKEQLLTTLKKVDVLCINETEAYLLSGESNLSSAADKIFSLGPKTIILKRGEYGAALFTPTCTFAIPAYLTSKIVDPTGCGDSFAGALMGYIAKENLDRNTLTENPELWSKALKHAILNGCVMASFTIEDFSLNRIIKLDKTEFLERKSQFEKMISI